MARNGEPIPSQLAAKVAGLDLPRRIVHLEPCSSLGSTISRKDFWLALGIAFRSGMRLTCQTSQESTCWAGDGIVSQQTRFGPAALTSQSLQNQSLLQHLFPPLLKAIALHSLWAWTPAEPRVAQPQMPRVIAGSAVTVAGSFTMRRAVGALTSRNQVPSLHQPHLQRRLHLQLQETSAPPVSHRSSMIATTRAARQAIQKALAQSAVMDVI